MASNNQRMGPDAKWNALVQTAFHLNERFQRVGPGEERHDAARAAALSVLEAFPAALDPVDDFQAYAVRRFLLAFVAALEDPEV